MRAANLRRVPVPADKLSRLLARLEAARRNRGDQEGIEKILLALEAVPIDAAGPLIALHDLLLYFSAYPSRPAIRRLATRLRKDFAARVERLTSYRAYLSALDWPDHPGIAGTSIHMAFSLDLLKSVALHSPKSVRIDWERLDDSDRLASPLPRFLPLLDE